MKYLHDFTTKWVYLIFIVVREILFVVHLKHSSFWPTEHVSLSLSLSLSLCVCAYEDNYGPVVNNSQAA